MKRNKVDCKHPISLCLSLFFILALSQFAIIKIVPDAEALRYSDKTDLSDVDGSFIGKESDSLGFSLDIVGDVNGDGYDDIVISGIGNGKVYLIFGKSGDWIMDLNISEVNASFIEEDSGDNFGYSVAGPGDINGDGFDDILIGANGRKKYRGEVYLILGKEVGWFKNTRIIQAATASFLGETSDNYLGSFLNYIGDINGDGFDDILMSAPFNSDAGISAGKVYLFLGKSTGWKMRTSVKEANTFFQGKGYLKYTGDNLGGGNDVNGDGFDDFLIGTGTIENQTYLIFGKPGNWSINASLSEYATSSFFINANSKSSDIIGDINNDGFDDIIIGDIWNPGGKGRVFLFFGKRNGWTLDMGPGDADASFIGERVNDWTGESIAAAGDVNGDGFDDFIVGAPHGEDDSVPGRAYLILGKASGWRMNVSLAEADASFWGEENHDYTGISVSGNGDINGDGYDDIIIGAKSNSENGYRAGKVYIIFPELNQRPSKIDSIRFFSDSGFEDETNVADMNDRVYIEAVGEDGNASSRNVAEVTIISNETDTRGIKVRLLETGESTGVYHGSFYIKNLSHDSHQWIGARPLEHITVRSVESPDVYADLAVGEVIMRILPMQDDTTALEDKEYSQTYGYDCIFPVNWSFDTNAPWLNWTVGDNGTSGMLTGVPGNGDIGSYWVELGIEDRFGDHVERNFTLEVINTNDPPVITEGPANVAYAGFEYVSRVMAMDPDPSNDTLTFALGDDRPKGMEMDASTGELRWTPQKAGDVSLEIVVSDGKSSTRGTYTISVVENHAPVIERLKDVEVKVGEELSLNVTARDDDPQDELRYVKVSGPPGMNVGPEGHIQWTPGRSDIGTHKVVIEVSDGKESTRKAFKVDVTDPEAWVMEGYFLMAIAVVVVLVGAITAILIMKRRRGRREDERGRARNGGRKRE